MGNVISGMDAGAVWVFPLAQAISAESSKGLSELISKSLVEWNSHGAALRANIEIVEGCFIVVSTEEAQSEVSGCAKDSLRRSVQECLGQLGLVLADHSIVFYSDSTHRVVFCSREDFVQRVKAAEITETTTVFDTSVQTYADYKAKFRAEASSSWHWGLVSN